ncbi:MAG: serine hydrolase [Candidatus Nanopelagicales bacterium]
MNDQRPSKARFVVRRTLVFGLAFFALIFILRLASGSIPSQPVAGSAAPIPIPLVTPAFDCEANSPIPQTFVDAWSTEFQPTNFNVTVIDLVEGCTYSMGDSAATFPTASTGKVIVATRALEMVAAGSLDYANIANDLELMITQSDNGAADRLFKIIGKNEAVVSIATRYGLASTTTGGAWGTIMTNARDQALLLNQVVGIAASPLPEGQRAILRDLMIRVNPEQAWGAGSAGGIPELWTSAVKNGWYLSVAGDRPPVGLWRVNTLGYVSDPSSQSRWIFTGYSNTWPTEERGISAWNAITAQLTATLGIR